MFKKITKSGGHKNIKTNYFLQKQTVHFLSKDAFGESSVSGKADRLGGNCCRAEEQKKLLDARREGGGEWRVAL